MTVIEPSSSVRVTRRPPCSQVIRRPSRSIVLPFEFHRRLAEDAQVTVVFTVPHAAVVGDVAEQYIPAGREIHRTFGPAHAGGDALDRHGTREARKPGLSETAFGLFERFDMRIRITTARQRPQWQ